ncbi:MAG TPA: DUF4395 domain-containing protein [Acidimicrobiia bacterium]|nr:DUF4395 domain-containing protein [Acidimicrobiia bacterium]
MPAPASPSRPAPIDPRGPRWNQAVLATGLVTGFVVDWWYVAVVFAFVLALGAAFGPRYGPVLRFYAEIVRPRLGPPRELEDPRPPRFAATLGVVFLTVGSIAFLAGASVLGWAFVLLVATLAGLSAVTGLCLGCQVWLFAARRRNVELVA